MTEAEWVQEQILRLTSQPEFPRSPWEGRPSRFTGDMIPGEVPFPEEEDLEEEIEEEEEQEDD